MGIRYLQPFCLVTRQALFVRRCLEVKRGGEGSRTKDNTYCVYFHPAASHPMASRFLTEGFITALKNHCFCRSHLEVGRRPRMHTIVPLQHHKWLPRPLRTVHSRTSALLLEGACAAGGAKVSRGAFTRTLRIAHAHLILVNAREKMGGRAPQDRGGG